jgi:putative selenate reductase
MIHILKDRLGWGDSDELGCIFNMSVGYNLEGIQSPTVQAFLDNMADCAAAKAKKVPELAPPSIPGSKDLDIPDRISDNITISTMHGCPPEEVEKIGRYFIEERGLHTTIKLNPTLLGPADVRRILNERVGFQGHGAGSGL